jgi:hypothetical protein
MIKKFHVRYIDQTTSKTVEKTITDIEQHDLYKLQREGKISIIDIHRVSEGSEKDMKVEDIRRILETAGWIKTVSAPPEIIDYQRSKPYNRLIIYPSDAKYLTEKYLRQLMAETNLSLHGEIWLEAKKEFSTTQEKWKVRAKPTVEEVKKIPEGVETVKYAFTVDKDAEVAEAILDAITTGKYEFRSAVNVGTMVRCVMYKKGEKIGTPIKMIATDKEMAWHLQQLIDWCLKSQAKILATRREGKLVEVAFRMEGIKPMPKEEKEKLWYHFKKTDGWTLVGNEK